MAAYRLLPRIVPIRPSLLLTQLPPMLPRSVEISSRSVERRLSTTICKPSSKFRPNWPWRLTYTLAEFVYGFLANNPVIYDGSNLFTAGAPHNNLGSSALSTAAMQAGVTAMREQTNYAGKRLGLRLATSLCRPNWSGRPLLRQSRLVCPASNAERYQPNAWLCFGNRFASADEYDAVVHDWGPREIDTIEIGFVNGAVNPVLLVQDSALLGNNFLMDIVSYKCRHEFGGTITDFRGLWRGI